MKLCLGCLLRISRLRTEKEVKIIMATAKMSIWAALRGKRHAQAPTKTLAEEQLAKSEA